MLGISYGELFLLIGATAALVGPKDLPIIARTAGRLAGRAIGYVQLARGQIQNVMEQSQASQVHKELKDQYAQLEAIKHEIRSGIFIMNPNPLIRTLTDNQEPAPASGGPSDDSVPQNFDRVSCPSSTISKESSSTISTAANSQSQAAAYARLAESLKDGSLNNRDAAKPDAEMGLLAVLPISAESAGLLPSQKDNANGADIMLEAVLEAEVAQNANYFVVQHQNQIKCE